MLARTVDSASGVMRTERLIGCRQPIPSVFQRLFGLETSLLYFREISEVDPRLGEYRAQSANLTGNDLITLSERIEYTRQVHGTSSNTTLMRQEAGVSVNAGFERMRRYVEDACVSRFHANAELGRMGLEQVIRHLFSDSPTVAVSSSSQVAAQAASPDEAMAMHQ